MAMQEVEGVGKGRKGRKVMCRSTIQIQACDIRPRIMLDLISSRRKYIHMYNRGCIHIKVNGNGNDNCSGKQC